MLRFYPERFLQCMNRLETIYRTIPDDNVTMEYDEINLFRDRTNLLGNLGLISEICDEAKLSSIKGQTRRIMNTVSHSLPIRHCDLRRTLVALQERIYDALEELVCLQVPSGKADYYNEAKLFGDEVALKFSSANYDIEEAGKSFAVGRYTATVFHLMRVVEVGVRAFAKGLNVWTTVSTAQPSWGEVLRLTNQEIQRLNKSGDPDWISEKQSFFENIQSDLSAVKNSWRNTTMHVQKQYDEERAEDIYNSVKGFTRHIAKHLDEDGNFSA
jgi:hypothetical protein